MKAGLLLPLEGSGFTPPSVKDFQFDQGLFGTEWINKPFLQAVISVVLILCYWLWVSRKLHILPGRSQFVAESLYNFVRNTIARDVIGHDFKKYVPYLLALFCFIVMNNLFGVFFLFMYPTFASIGFPYALALLSWFVYVGSGFAKHGASYLKNSLIPPGVPVYLYPLIVPLELLSNFVTRPITLALRLFANLFAGHLVILVLVVGGAFLISLGGPMIAAGGVSLFFSLPVFALEIFVGCLQAYIFTLLTAQYVSSSLVEEH